VVPSNSLVQSEADAAMKITPEQVRWATALADEILEVPEGHEQRQKVVDLILHALLEYLAPAV
jgi:hypothetical protein